MDTDDYVDTAGQNTFFFQQPVTYRRAPRRFKKHPEELPQDLRFAHLNPRIAAILAGKEKEKAEEGPYDDLFGRRSLLPRINETVNSIRHQLNSTLTNDEDSQRFVFAETRAHAPSVLILLARVLYNFEGFRVNIPKSLERLLLSNLKELAIDVHFVPREWQIPSNRDEYYQKMAKEGEVIRSDESKDGTVRLGSSSASIVGTGSRAGDMDDARSVRSVKSNRSETGNGGASPTKGASKVTPRGKNSRTSALTDITEEGLAREPSGRTGDTMPTILVSKRESKEKNSIPPRARTRLEKYKTSSNYLDPTRDLPKGSYHGPRRSLVRDDASNAGDSVHSESGKCPSGRSSVSRFSIHDQPISMIDKTGYWAVVQFQLSSKACEDKGWIVHPSPCDDRERETLLEWATQRLQLAIKQREDEEAKEKESGSGKHPVSVRYYGDSRRDVMLKYGKRSAVGLRSTPSPGATSSSIMKGQRPRIPPMMPDNEGRKLFMTTVSDGSATVFYPSEQAAIVTSSCGPTAHSGFHIIVYDDAPSSKMLACFTPSGRGCCYHDNGTISFLATETGGTTADKQGAITKRWNWPTLGAKMAVPVVIELNEFITLRCLNQTQTFLYFACQKETMKVCVGAVATHDPAKLKDEQGTLISGLPFSSSAAREALRSPKPKPSVTKIEKGKKLKSKEKKFLAKEAPELQRLLELPDEPTPNDAESDKDLYRLRRKIRNLVDDWLEHYRLAVGIRSPHLGTVHDTPRTARRRLVKSAKPPSSGVRVMLESLATQMPQPSVEPRAPSAPPESISEKNNHGEQYLLSIFATFGRERPDVTGSFTTGSSNISGDSRPSSVAFTSLRERDVTFDESPVVEIEPDDTTLFESRTITFDEGRTLSSARSSRVKSAPQRLTGATLPDSSAGLPIGACPVNVRHLMFGEEVTPCRCNRHKMPVITDLEYDEFIRNHVPRHQLIVVAAISSLYPNKNLQMLESLYMEKNRNRTRPCMQSRQDPFRIFLYDMATAAEFTDHTQPLLLRRHNVVPGMFLMYEGGKLVFCDHIFNGYGNNRKDFQKQMMLSRRSASQGKHLPRDFRFSPQHGRHGARAAWGGEIGGAGVDRYGSSGVSGEATHVKKNSSLGSITSSEDSDAVPLGGEASAMRYISLSLAAASLSAGASEMSTHCASTESACYSMPSAQVTGHIRPHTSAYPTRLPSVTDSIRSSTIIV